MHRILGRAIAVVFVVALMSLSAAESRAQDCGDGIWEDGEFCGRDAYLVTGEPDMNHDCVIDMLDVGLFATYYNTSSPNADFNGDGRVNLIDHVTLVQSFSMQPVIAPCAPSGTTPDGCDATLSLSLSSDSITARQNLSGMSLVIVYLIAQGLQDAQVVEYALEYSDNLQLADTFSPIGWTEFTGGGNIQGYSCWASTAGPVSGTATIAQYTFIYDGNGYAYINLVNNWDVGGGIRWATSDLDQRISFAATSNIGINMLDEVGWSSCDPANQVPSVSSNLPADWVITIAPPLVVPNFMDTFTVIGNASDADGAVTLVEYRVGNGPWQVATGTDNWSVTLDLPVGATYFQYRATDDVGAVSPTYSGTITRSATDDFSLLGAHLEYPGVRFRWQNAGAESYLLEVDDDPAFNSPEVTPLSVNFQDINQSRKDIGANWFFKGDWHWRVTALFPGDVSLVSDVGTFTYDTYETTEPDWDPLYRLYSPTAKDHFYCGNLDHQARAQDVGYREEGVEGHVAYEPFDDPGIAPIYRLLRMDTDAHFYTADETVRNDSIQFGNYLYEGITGYAYDAPQPGQVLVPLYHLQKQHDVPATLDNFYTVSEFERQNALNVHGFVDKGIMAYVSPAGDMGLMAWNKISMAARGVSLDNGNFKHHEATGLTMPGIGLPLQFSHQYNSRGVYYPDQLRSMGPGWRHNYSSCITEVNGLLLVSWANGAEHVYDPAVETCLVEGVYDKLAMETSDRARITRKDQVSFLFERPVAGYPFLLAEIRDRNGNTVTCAYESAEPRRLTRVTGPAGRTLDFAYRSDPDMELLLETVTDPVGRQIAFAYTDSTRDLKSYTDAESHTTHYAYVDSLPHEHQLRQVTMPDGTTIDCEYEGRRLRSQQWGGQSGGMDLAYNGNLTAVSYTGTPRTYSVSHIDPSTPFATKRPDVVTNGTETNDFNYDDPSHPALPSAMIDARGNSHTFEYDPDGNLTREVHPLGVEMSYTYDTMNNVTSVTDPRTNTTTYGYDGAGNLTTVTKPEGGVTILGRDGRGQLTSVTTDVGTTTMDYDTYGNLVRITDPLTNYTEFVVDMVGRVSEVIDANRNSSYYEVDDRGLVTRITDAEGGIATLDYDPNGALISVAGPGPVSTTWTYDDGFLTGFQTPVSNTAYGYNDDGSLRSRTTAKGPVLYEYDAAGHLVSVNGSRLATLTRDVAGNLTGVADAACQLGFTYDDLDRVKSVTDHWGNTVAFDYDDAGNTTRITYPGGLLVEYGYDDDGRMEFAGNMGAGQGVGYTYHPDGRLAQISRTNYVMTALGYDGAGRLDGMEHSGPQGVIASYDFTLDAMGNHLTSTVVEPLGAPELVSEPKTYSYDAARQLVGDGSTAFTYDGDGNLATMTGGRSLDLQFDVEGRLTSFTGQANAQFLYDVFGNRRQAVRNGVTTRYVLDPRGASRVLMEIDENGVPLAYYMYGLGLIGRVTPAGETHYYLGNNVGSVIAMTDTDGAVTHQYSYDPFGRLVDSVEADANPFTYIGMHGVMREEAGLYFMRARYYDSETGRFLSEDPVWNTNLYAYAENNPLLMIDPDGRSASDPSLKSFFVRSAAKIKGGIAGRVSKVTYAADWVAKWSIWHKATQPLWKRTHETRIEKRDNEMSDVEDIENLNRQLQNRSDMFEYGEWQSLTEGGVSATKAYGRY